MYLSPVAKSTMELTEVLDLDEDEKHTLERALALYAAYTREMEVDMLVGDENDAAEVRANHNRAKEMHRQIFNMVEPHTYEEERIFFEQAHDRLMDVNDFSPFDFYKYLNEEKEKDYNKYKANYYVDGEPFEKTFEGDSMEITNNMCGSGTYVIKKDGDIVWSHDVLSTRNVEKIDD